MFRDTMKDVTKRGHAPCENTPNQINSTKVWYKSCGLIGGFCDESSCPACVNTSSGYQCSINALMDVVDNNIEDMAYIRHELANIKHRTMCGGW